MKKCRLARLILFPSGCCTSLFNPPPHIWRRIQVSALPTIAKTLRVPIEDLLNASTKTASKRGPASKLQQQLEQISRLPKAQQKFVSQMLDTVLQQAQQ